MRIGAALATGLFLITTQAFGQTADWEVVDRFRVLDQKTPQQGAPPIDQDDYVNRIVKIVKARKYLPLIESNGDVVGEQLNWKTAWVEAGQQYSPSWFHNRKRRVRVSVAGFPAKAECYWSVRVAKEDPLPEQKNDCGSRVLKDIPLDLTTEVDIRVVSPRGAEVNIPTLKIKPTDLKIAVLGDSYISGEGNPHLTVLPPNSRQISYPAIWWDTRCHRSLLSSGPQAAGFLAYQNKKQSVTFVSYACSGAEIKEGILEGYAGRQTIPQTQHMWKDASLPGPLLQPLLSESDKTNKLKPQIDALRSLLCASADGCVKPDVLVIAVGGNDIAFGEIARELILSSPPSGRKTRKAWEKKWEDALDEPLKNLGDGLANLATAVRRKIAPKNVILYQYVDPSMYGRDVLCGTAKTNGGRFTRFMTQYSARSHNGTFAPDTEVQRREAYAKNSSLFNLLITKDESRLAHIVVTELNKRIWEARKNGWTDAGADAHILRLQDLVGPDGLRRGLCAKNSWFIGIFDSWERQDWIPEDKINSYPLILASEDNCSSKGGKWDAEKQKCMVAAGPLTSGVLHPNFFGHYNIGQRLLSTLKKVTARVAASQ